MTKQTIDEHIAAASAADGPHLVDEPDVRAGGVDPLGLRQINFQLMDLVFPGLNNVARHIRPYVVVAWAWRRAAAIAAEQGGKTVAVEDMRDFTSRIEVLFGWSQFLANPKADLPGRDVLARLVGMDRFAFAGRDWEKLREGRTYSTALTAPITYGPSLKGLRWVGANPENRSVFITLDQESDYLDSFEACLEPALDHPAFSRFGPVEVDAHEIRVWADLWAMDAVTSAERKAAQTRVFGTMAVPERRAAFELMQAAVLRSGPDDVANVRALMAEPKTWSGLSDPAQAAGLAWREVQIRQLFRLSLEGLFFWATRWIDGEAKSIGALASDLLVMAKGDAGGTAGDWVAGFAFPPDQIVNCLNELDDALSGDLDAMPAAIMAGLSTALGNAPIESRDFERADRLPVAAAAKQAENWGGLSPQEFLNRVLSIWVMAQHTYWAVGRGLADARSRGKSIMRLKLILEDGGWTNVPGTAQSRPNPTPDRLETALRLAVEAGALQQP